MLSPDEQALARQMNGSDADWLVSMTPVIAGWKAEDAAFASYCNNRDMGIKPEALARFYTPYWASDFEKRYRDEKFLAEVERRA